MGTSDITLSALVATPTIRGNKLSWTVTDPRNGAIPNLAIDHVDVYASTTNDFATASVVTQGITDALHAGLVEEQIYYYWVIPYNVIGSPGARFPVSATAGVSATAIGISGLAFGLANGKIVATVVPHASPDVFDLLIAIKNAAGNDPSAGDPVYVAFRNAALGTGNYQIRQIIAAVSLTLPSGATAGFSANDPSRLWLSLFDVGDGTVKLAAKNCSTSSGSIYPISDFGVASSVSVNTSADAAGVFYTDATLTSRPFRVCGLCDWNSGLATPGIWSATPDLIRMYGPGIKLPGDIIQSVISIDAVFDESSPTPIPVDDTIPQNTEGKQFFSNSITPTSPVNFFENDINLVGTAASGLSIVALFQDSIANALAAIWSVVGGAPVAHKILHRKRASIAVQTTFKVRAGPGTAVTFDFNGISSTRWFGGVVSSHHRTHEIMG